MYSTLRKLCIAALLLVGAAAAMAAYLLPWWALAGLGILAAMFCKKTQILTAYGTSRFAGFLDVARAKMTEGNGLAIGLMSAGVNRGEGVKALFDKHVSDLAAVQMALCAVRGKLEKPPVQMVRLPPKAVHVMCVSPTSGGKTSGLVVPFILENDESAVVLDPSGELARITSAARKRMGHRVVLLDNYRCVSDTPDTYNPLSDINPASETAIDDCHDLGEQLVVKTGQEREPYWTAAAEIWIASMAAATVNFASTPAKNLQMVRTLVTNAKAREDTIQLMRECQDWNGMLRRLGDQLAHFVDKNLNSVLTSVDQHLSWLDTPSYG